ncbi:MAG: homoserine dehydrogenase [Oscillospiraceae bacterium]|nr:homoserine dehydrogenase [Oscillospiraceae bacterium]
MAKVAIMGYGTVGSGVYDIIKKNAEKLCLSSNGERVDLKYILDIREFDDHPEKELFTKDFNDILNDREVSVVAEVMGGLHPAYEFTKSLLESGKSVVTSNKELVATYGVELLEIAREKNVNYLFEASVGGGIPIIRPMHQCLTANNILTIAGILNGTTNYILNEMISKGKTFESALKDAQDKGYAERNPAADIEGHDACRKIAILSSLASGKFVDYNDISTEGITNITSEDVKVANSRGYVIKLIGYAKFTENGRIYSVVAPMMMSKEHPLAKVNGVMNAIMINGDCVGDLMFYGAGAGKMPTASAVVADIVDAVKHKERSKKIFWEKPDENIMASEDDAKFRYVIRTTDSPEKISDIFGEEGNVIDEQNIIFTKPLGTSELKEKLSKLDSVVSYIRFLEDFDNGDE